MFILTPLIKGVLTGYAQVISLEAEKQGFNGSESELLAKRLIKIASNCLSQMFESYSAGKLYAFTWTSFPLLHFTAFIPPFLSHTHIHVHTLSLPFFLTLSLSLPLSLSLSLYISLFLSHFLSLSLSNSFFLTNFVIASRVLGVFDVNILDSLREKRRVLPKKFSNHK